MDRQINDTDLSDDEIFIGKLTLKEVKKLVMMDRYRHSSSCSTTKADDSDRSLKIIEACSEPDLMSGISLEDSYSSLLSSASSKDTTTKGLDITTDNNNFLNKKKEELDNTLDVVEYILNNGPQIEKFHGFKSDKENSESNNCNQSNVHETEINSEHTNPSSIILSELNNMQYCSKIEEATPLKEKGVLNNCETSQKLTKSTKKMFNNMEQENSHSTSNCQMQVNLFKTPKRTVSPKKHMQTSSTSKLNLYQHISSPVATYIKNGPQVPLLKDVRPKKPLSNVTLIPKPITNSKIKANKENNNLPSVAYKNAKSVKVIKMPDEAKLPKNQWAKTLSSSLHKPIVIKHTQREINKNDKKSEPTPEDSFANLTLHQADISVCTQKSAYNKLK